MLEFGDQARAAEPVSGDEHDADDIEAAEDPGQRWR
jgi:hypothetical protein